MKTCEIWLAEAHGTRRLVCLHARPDRESVCVYLLTNEVECAGAHDLLLPAAASGLPYALLVERDVQGVILHSQLVRRLARFPRRLLAGPGVGLPIISRRDSRWDWKLVELTALWALGRDWLVALDDSE